MSGFDKEKWRAELRGTMSKRGLSRSDGHAINDDTAFLALLERAYAEGRADGIRDGSKHLALLWERGWQYDSDGASEWQMKAITRELDAMALAAARGTP